MSKPGLREVEDLWMKYEVAQAKYEHAVRETLAEARNACAPLRSKAKEAYNAYRDRSEYYEGKK
jgi:hypothetical protein